MMLPSGEVEMLRVCGAIGLAVGIAPSYLELHQIVTPCCRP